MLHEISHLTQSDRHQVKRWFSSRDMDLFVWSRNQIPVRFQLCFNKRSDEHAISWNCQHQLQLYRVDSGETLPDQYKQTPLLIVTCKHKNLSVVARDFLAASRNIEAGIADFIYARLMEFPAAPAKYHVTHINPPAER